MVNELLLGDLWHVEITKTLLTTSAIFTLAEMDGIIVNLPLAFRQNRTLPARPGAQAKTHLFRKQQMQTYS